MIHDKQTPAARSAILEAMCRPAAALAIAAITLAACDDGAPAGEPVRQEVTFWQDVAPIYFTHCVACHQDSGVAPFALDSYDSARRFARAAAEATRTRQMPPGLVDGTGDCGEFRDSHWLSDEQIQTIGKWAENGAPAGQPRRDLRAATPGSLGEATELRTPRYTPRRHNQPYARDDDFASGYEIVPGNRAVVHHVVGYLVDLDRVVADGRTNRQVLRELDAESADVDGWPCFDAGRGVEIDSMPISWVPGTGVVEFPAGTGLRLRPNQAVVAQVHYNLAVESGVSEQTIVRLRLEERVEREGFLFLRDEFLGTVLRGEPAVIPPGQPAFEYRWSGTLAQDFALTGASALELAGVMLHMHQRGRRIRVDIADSAGRQRCAARIPQWNYHWQRIYFYETAIPVRPESTLSVNCTFDSRDRREPISAGWGTQDEMCAVGFYYTVPADPS
jgi:mono/diheme cytochrome c family protein